MTVTISSIAAIMIYLTNWNRGPRHLFSGVFLTVPILYYWERRIKAERMKLNAFFEKHFEENMEWFPVTRRAFSAALEIKNKEIAELQKELEEKQKRLAEKLAKNNPVEPAKL